MTLTKPIFRKECLKKIKNAPKHNKFYRDAALNLKLTKELKKLKGKKILFYYSLPFEASVVKTLQKMRKNCEIYVPFMQGESFKMVPFRLPLKQNEFCIFEAGNTLRNINNIDIAIVPAVGVDGNLQRIGFGKGMYDRFFEKLQRRPYTIFVQPVFCYTNKFICDSYDVTCDLLLTPRVRLKSKNRKN
ncbi:MAG: 5-formyltetrahydrofolate cyclo-ligase [Helicobacteraceae bacterium CG2_30_36_10]|nr:MAG: 5-formyltetrahydrofolate cyclo-ligase [Helicobacteraceae bacterium CG2_30_36_10]